MFILDTSYWETRTTPDKGRGVFALKDISAGTVIGDYLGRVLPEAEEDAYAEKYGLYMMQLTDNVTIFPDPETVGVHMLNSSCANNCDTYDYKGHALIIALRHILPGEEMTISYLLDPPTGEAEDQTHPCYCRSMICRGTMYASQHAVDEFVKYREAKASKGTEEHVFVTDEKKYLQPLSEYPKIIAEEDIDENIFDIFASETNEGVAYTDSVVPTFTEIRHRIRETGREILLPNLKLKIFGTMDGLLICKSIQ